MTAYPRSLIYSGIHKAIRKMLFDLLYLAGKTDLDNLTETEALQKQLHSTSDFLHLHAVKEEHVVLPVVEIKRPGFSKADADSHERIEAQLEELCTRLEQLKISIGTHGMDDAYNWYVDLNQFVSDYLAHMTEEEHKTARVIQEVCSRNELDEMNAKIQTSITPDQFAYSLNYMIPALSHQERLGMFKAVRQNAPAPVFNAVIQIAQRTLTPNELTRLEEALFLADPIMNGEYY